MRQPCRPTIRQSYSHDPPGSVRERLAGKGTQRLPPLSSQEQMLSSLSGSLFSLKLSSGITPLPCASSCGCVTAGGAPFTLADSAVERGTKRRGEGRLRLWPRALQHPDFTFTTEATGKSSQGPSASDAAVDWATLSLVCCPTVPCHPGRDLAHVKKGAQGQRQCWPFNRPVMKHGPRSPATPSGVQGTSLHFGPPIKSKHLPDPEQLKQGSERGSGTV